MKNYIKILTLTVTIILVQCPASNTDWSKSQQFQTVSSNQCPPWFFYNATTKQCECYSSPSTDDIVKCTKQGALLSFGYCMTQTEGKGFFVSLCEYFKLSSFENVTKEDHYIVLSDNISELNDFMCGPLNRKSRLCSECIDGFGPSAISMGQTCSNCTNVWYGLPLYLFLEFIPITIFYFIVILFQNKCHFSTDGSLCILLSCWSIHFFSHEQIHVRYKLHIYIFKILITLYGIWNLDFFRYVMPPFCISPHIINTYNFSELHICLLPFHLGCCILDLY